MADDPEVLDDESTPKGLAISKGQMIALGLLGVLGVLAVALTIAAKRQAADMPGDLLDTDDWKESLRHFAAATDYRFRGLEDAVQELGTLLGKTPPPPPAPVDRTFAPSPEPVTMPAPNGADMGEAPRPAAVSLPDAAD